MLVRVERSAAHLSSNRRPPIDYLARTREQYAALGHPVYRWVENEGAPTWAGLRRPLSESRIALVASGGVYAAGQVAFHHRDDTSFRTIDSDVDVADLRTSHFAYDQTAARVDPNVVFPIDPLRRSVEAGRLGSLARHSYAFMGGIYSSRRVSEELAPEIAQRVVEDEVDLVLLVPV
jgi:D-proline reductase (dithiol) PrdB